MTVQTSTPSPLIALPNAVIEPPPVTQWPIAPGYWLLGCLLLTTLVFLYKRYRRTLWRRQALTELDRIYQDYLISPDPYYYCKQANALLKRVALMRFPNEHIAPLSGIAWLQFLDACCVKVHFCDHFSWFAQLPYQETLTTQEALASGGPSVLKLHRSIRRWIKHHQLKRPPIKTKTHTDTAHRPQHISNTGFQGAAL